MNPMKYRRFGRTELQMPVFSCGGMRYQQAWGDLDPDKIEKANQENLEATIHRSLELGINHIETARGYGTSEMQLGRVLPKLPREKMIIQTKVGVSEDQQTFIDKFEQSMQYLQLDYVDLLSFHGLNNEHLLDCVMRKGGLMEVARRFQKEGRARFIGFSTHGPESAITAACNTGEFDYFNVHWYFVNNLNWPSIEAATRHDMGVFIISPTDKGGRLQEPSAKLTELCAPLSPIGFNDLYCLSHPQVHTLSIGADKPSDFDEHVSSLKYYDNAAKTIAPIQAKLEAEMDAVLGSDWRRRWFEGVPEAHHIPGDINILEILRLYTYAKAFDLEEWARGRYNLMSKNDHFFPGEKASEVQDRVLEPLLKNSPFKDRIPQILRETHEMLDGEAKRLSES